MHFNGITKRWVLNTLGVISALLLLVSIIASIAIHFYYYEYVEMTLNSRADDSVSNFFSLYSNTDEQFESRAREFVEGFKAKDIMEVWVIDKQGNVIISSSGFPVNDPPEMPDYQEALQSTKSDTARWTGKLPSGEKVMALTQLLGENSGAVRYLISLEEVDSQVSTFILLIFFVCLLSIALVAMSGSFFIQSIVKPVMQINEAAQKFAHGDFSTRIDSHHYNDEISELGETINYMASELSEADRVKNDFISTISHELRTPLTAIKGWGETLLQVGDTDPTLLSKGMQVIIDESGRLTGIVEELLDFSRMQSGKLSMRLEKIDVLAELDDAVFVFRERALREGIELIYNVPHLPAPMNGDANRIKQVFVNILDNAFKYTEQGGKVIVVANIIDTTLEIMVGDTGCGIPEEDLPHVTEKFYRSCVSARGSGIGLAVVDEIIKLHHGTLKINSVVGEGTTVSVLLPIEPVVLTDERSSQNE
ncbi:MAG: ATP-binding protein [Candidatus Fimivicinus sp.]|nr:ATP-binding protein [Oscillospiraceae bacterium]MDY5591134.1 ATP-binding protein [Candidatus Fimivicinus sp.]